MILGTTALASVQKAATAGFVPESIIRNRPISKSRLFPARRIARSFAVPGSRKVTLGISAIAFMGASARKIISIELISATVRGRIR